MNQQARFKRFRIGLHTLYLPVYDAICEGLANITHADGAYWGPICGIRTADEQDMVFAIGRTIQLTSKRVTQARAWESPHQYGMASDWALFEKSGAPIWTHKCWGEYQSVVQGAGAEWGGAFKSNYDAPHNQLKINIRWSDLRPVVLSQGTAKAFELIAASLEINQ